VKLIHLADLHIGKRVNEFSMLEDQQYVLGEILRLIDEERPDGIVMAGDIYDKSVPAGEAVEIFDQFLTDLVARRKGIYLVSGNHDSAERLNFGSRIMQQAGVYIAGTFKGELLPIAEADEYGPVNFYLLPFIKPAMVSAYYPEVEILSYQDAVQAVIDKASINPHERNILVAHQFITSGSQSPERSESETIAVGGLDNIDAAVFDAFDYVALGHLHGPQSIGRATVRYAGSPLKYSFSEAHHHKSVTVVELNAKNNLQIRMLELQPRHSMREIKGPIAQLLEVAATTPEENDDYIRAILTDQEEIYDAIGQLRNVYPNIMRIDFENSRTRLDAPSKTAASGDVARKSPLELFDEFYLNQNNCPLSDGQKKIVEDTFAKIGGVPL